MQHKNNRYHEIARIGKVHGLDGTVKVAVRKEAETLFDKDKLFYLKNRRGDIFPARITDIRVESKNQTRMFFVKFDRIADRSQAELFRDTAVYTDEEVTPSEETPADSIEGFEVRDMDGLLGYVAGLMTNPAHPIIEVTPAGKDRSENLLIPWVDEYVRSVDEGSKTVLCQNLNQLKNL